MFKKILDKVFNKAPPDPLPDEILAKAIEEQCLKNDLEPTPHFLSKVLIQLLFWLTFLKKNTI